MIISSDTVQVLAMHLINGKYCANRRNRPVGERSFRAHFGIAKEGCTDLWNRICRHSILEKNQRPVHLLWTLYFLHVHPNESVASGFVTATPKTYRVKVWSMIKVLEKLSFSLVSYYLFLYLNIT